MILRIMTEQQFSDRVLEENRAAMRICRRVSFDRLGSGPWGISERLGSFGFSINAFCLMPG